MAMDEERFAAAGRKSAGKEEQRGMRLLRVYLAELGKVASGSATQGLWLGHRKVRSPSSWHKLKPTPW